MNHYPESQYPNLYNQIVKDWNFRYGKFHPIPYPNLSNKDTSPMQPLLPKPIRKLPK